jgi:hypothetical protein
MAGRWIGGMMVVAALVGCGDDGGRGTASSSGTTGNNSGSTGASSGDASTGSGATAGTNPTGGVSASGGMTTGETTGDGPTTGAITDGGTTQGSGGTTQGGGGTTQGGGGTTQGDTDTGGPTCEPPDVLIVLDRTLSMHKTPDGLTPVDAPAYKSSKWYQAITALEGVATKFDASVRFGLELWPRDPGGGKCITLAERVTNSKMATNPACETSEVPVDVGLGTGQAIADLLDPATTTICSTTPTGEALYSAGAYLEGIQVPGRDQYVILVTDGADWDFSCPDPDPLKAVQDLEKKGIKTFVVGFNGEEAQLGALSYLNNLACAGQTAKGFPGPCYDTADGWQAVAVNPAFPVYLHADNAENLEAALQSVIDDVCCGCAKGCDPPEVLFTLDRTLSMHKTADGMTPVDAPEYKSSKWYQALTALEEVATKPGLDAELRFGLELWPRDPGGGKCITLTERVTNSKNATNPQCEFAEIPVAPALNSGAMIAATLDPATTLLCVSTPTGNALITAHDWMVDHIVPGRDQYVVLVTDGADWDFSCPNPAPQGVVRQLAAAGIKTYVVGFFGTEAEQKAAVFLNDLACAGQTAKGFPTPCQATPMGWQVKDPVDTKPLYLLAGDGELPTTLEGIAAEIAGMCVPG